MITDEQKHKLNRILGSRFASRKPLGDIFACIFTGPPEPEEPHCSLLQDPLSVPSPDAHLPDLNAEHPSFAALVVRYVRDRFDNDTSSVYFAAGISRANYSHIISNENYAVSKRTAIRMALGLQLSADEADALLKAAGYAFSESIAEDVVLRACIAAGIHDLPDINTVLAEHGIDYEY